MKKAFDLYVAEGNLDELKDKIEEILAVKLHGRSSDWLGEYYRSPLGPDWSVKLMDNVEYYLSEVYTHEEELSQDAVLLYVNGVTPTVAEVYREKLLASGLFAIVREEHL